MLHDVSVKVVAHEYRGRGAAVAVKHAQAGYLPRPSVLAAAGQGDELAVYVVLVVMPTPPGHCPPSVHVSIVPAAAEGRGAVRLGWAV